MEIRRKLALQFIAMVAFIIMLTSIAIYILFSQSRKEEFFDRLSSKAKLVAQMLIDIDEIDMDLLRKIEKNNPLSLPSEKIRIYDYKNNLIYSSDNDSTFSYSVDLINKVRLDNELRINRDSYEIVGHFYTGQYDRIVVFVAASDIFGIKKLKRLRIILVAVFFASLIIVFFSGRIFAARALNPISKLISEVDSIEASNLEVRLDEGGGKDEISRLAHTFNRFLKRLESSFKMQKTFIANASHEFRTPLTVLSGQLEVLLLKDRNTEDYKNTIKTTLEEIKNLTSISNRLLLLAQASSDFSNVNFTPSRIDDILWQSRQELRKRNEQYNIKVSFSTEIDSDDKLIVNGNELLLKVAFLNLMDNACKYSGSKNVNVLLSWDDNSSIKIDFQDNGIGISNNDIKNIFQPFYRSSEVMKIKGHGIGLSLVDKIVALHKGTINVTSTHGKGSVFAIILPLHRL